MTLRLTIAILCVNLGLWSRTLPADVLGQAALAVSLPNADAKLIVPLLDVPLRDPSVCRGPEGRYYLTGTTGLPGLEPINRGIELWRSVDLIHWESLGEIWNIDRDGTWQRALKKRATERRNPLASAVRAPEIHFVKNRFIICYSMTTGGIGLIESSTGDAIGPYRDLGRLIEQGTDPTLFAETTGEVYLIYGRGMVATLSDDLRSVRGRPRRLAFSPGGYLNTLPLDSDRPMRLGFHLRREGAVYQLSYRRSRDRLHRTSDDVYVTHARNLFGPYQTSYLAIPHAAGTCLFRTPAGTLMATFSGNSSDPFAAFRDQFGLVRLSLSPYGRIRPASLHILERGPVARLRPLLARETICNPSIVADGRGTHYLVAASTLIWDANLGASVRLWRSRDLNNWSYVDEIVNWDDMYGEPYCDEKGSIVSAELQYIRSKRSFYLVFSTVTDRPRTWLFRSISGRASGPYENAADSALVEGVDGYLFEDDDETVYLVWGDGHIARMNDRMTGLRGSVHHLQADSGGSIGDGGCSLMRLRDRYVLTSGQWSGQASEDSSYDLRIGSAKNVFGPYRMQPGLIPHAGHATLFRSKHGKLFATFSGHDKTAPFRDRLGILSLHVTPLGQIQTVPPFLPLPPAEDSRHAR